MDAGDVVLVVSGVVLAVIGGALYFIALEDSGLFDSLWDDDEPQEQDEHGEYLGAGR